MRAKLLVLKATKHLGRQPLLSTNILEEDDWEKAD